MNFREQELPCGLVDFTPETTQRCLDADGNVMPTFPDWVFSNDDKSEVWADLSRANPIEGIMDAEVFFPFPFNKIETQRARTLESNIRDRFAMNHLLDMPIYTPPLLLLLHCKPVSAHSPEQRLPIVMSTLEVMMRYESAMEILFNSNRPYNQKNRDRIFEELDNSIRSAQPLFEELVQPHVPEFAKLAATLAPHVAQDNIKYFRKNPGKREAMRRYIYFQALRTLDTLKNVEIAILRALDPRFGDPEVCAPFLLHWALPDEATSGRFKETDTESRKKVCMKYAEMWPELHDLIKPKEVVARVLVNGVSIQQATMILLVNFFQPTQAAQNIINAAREAGFD